MAATVGEERPCTLNGCGRPGKVIVVVGDWAPAICGACQARAVHFWRSLEAQEARRRERLQRKKERALIGLAATRAAMISARG